MLFFLLVLPWPTSSPLFLHVVVPRISSPTGYAFLTFALFFLLRRKEARFLVVFFFFFFIVVFFSFGKSSREVSPGFLFGLQSPVINFLPSPLSFFSSSRIPTDCWLSTPPVPAPNSSFLWVLFFSRFAGLF